MIKKSLEDKFAIAIDAYLSGIKEPTRATTEEYDELLKLGYILADKDFSKNSDKKAVLNKTLKILDEYKGNRNMKKSSGIRRAVAIAAVSVLACAAGISVMQTSFAQDIAEKVRNVISLEHITVSQMEERQVKTVSVPEELVGKIFDKEGNPIKVISAEKYEKLYTAEGEEIADLADGKIITVSQEEKIRKEHILEVRDPNELNKYTCFQVTLPKYLPIGYKFDRAKLYKDENGVVNNSKYIDLIFTNEKTGKYLYMQQSSADEETAYSMTTDGAIEQAKINGVDAIISDSRSIHWEVDDVLYMLSGRGEISKSELVKIAESIK